MNTSLISALAVALVSLPIFAAEAPKPFGLQLFAEGFVAPTTVVPVPGSDRLLIADQAGTIHVVGKDGKKVEELFMDVRPRLTKLNQGFDERGLLGLALHPKFAENKKFYVVYSAPRRESAPADWDHTMRLSQFTANADGATAKADSEKVLLEIDKPYFNHNGGMILFGPDNYLYFAVGDGGNANDQDEKGKPKGRPPEGNAQNLQTHMGKILRIDVDKGDPYSVPQDNPFVGKDAKPEIFAYGFRNPWRIAFDRGGNKELFAADVGQDAFEEVDIVVKGGNYGWRIKEGLHCFNIERPTKPLEDCPDKGANGEPLIAPIFEYKNLKASPRAADAMGISITGGYVYRGKALSGWQGKYIFADWSRAWVKPDAVLLAASKGQDGKWSWERIKPGTHPDSLPFYIVGFGEDAEGELYVLTNDSNAVANKSGKIFKLVP
ncbi:MAG TPA: PQQ-dependent sugar dehydrogenase [Verrucomicrobiae bacterium]